MLPSSLQQALARELGQPVVETRPVSGGDINQAAWCRLADGREMLVKWNTGRLPGLFTCEHRGLALIRATRTLTAPEVFAAAETDGDRPAFIALEWLGRGRSRPDTAVALGRGLAAMHRHTAETYGLDHDNYIGANPQPNTPADNWVDFFRHRRLGFQMELAARNGYLPAARRQRLERLLSRLEEWLPPHPPASLLHGDLWGGNWLVTASGEPALIDPAVYYGHREADLAFTELFGGFPPDFYRAYEAAWPLEPGYEERRHLYNLYHLLNHLNLFGEAYGGQVDAILRRYT